jgi:WD40 repeat protein
MAINVSCRCGQLLAVHEQHIGKRVACPVCRAVLTVPPPVMAIPPSAISVAPPATPPPAVPQVMPVQPPVMPVPSQVVPSPPAPAAPPAPPEEELAELTMQDVIDSAPAEEELPELTMQDVIDEDDEDSGGSYQLAGGASDGVNFAVTGTLARIRVRGDPITCLACGPDHKAALAADEETISFLDLQAKKAVPVRPRHRAPVSCLTISADGLLALSGDEDGNLLLWDVARHQPLRWLQGHRDKVRSAAFSLDRKYAVSGDVGGLICLWDIGTGGRLALHQACWNEAVNHVCFSPDGRRILGVGDAGKARLWSMRTGDIVLKMQKGSDNLRSAAFGQEGAVVVASSADEFKVNRWDLKTGERQRCFTGYAQKHPRIEQTFVTPNGCGLLALGHREEYGKRTRGDNPGAVLLAAGVVLGVAGGPILVPALSGAVSKAWLAQKTSAAMADALESGRTQGGYYLEFWDVASERGVQAVELGPDPPISFACSTDGHRVLAGFDDGNAYLFAL